MAKHFYTYPEAMAVVQKLGIVSEPQYKKRYREDPKLPAIPSKTYAGSGWVDLYVFFGKERLDRYLTYSEAQAAVRELGIGSTKEYLKRYLEDPKLPSTPSQFYKGVGWTTSYDFYGVDAPCFYTCVEAALVVKVLGIRTPSEYYERYKEDPKLPSQPSKFYACAGWKGWDDFVAREIPDFYSTYAEAKDAVNKMGFTSSTQYLKNYHVDPKLASNPSSLYPDDWVGWHDLLGKEKRVFYPTYDEAVVAVRRLGIITSEEYKKRAKEDRRLPAVPDQVYAGVGWTSWYDFLGKRKPSFYKTFAEARAAVQLLGIKSQIEYTKRCREDSRLPISPGTYYKHSGWTDWYDFLGKLRSLLYQTYEEARAAVQTLGFKGHGDYRRRRDEDPRLPSSPSITYADKGWVDSYDFYGKESPDAALDSYPVLSGDFERWIKAQSRIPSKRAAIRVFFSSFYILNDYPDEPRYLLLRKNYFNVEDYRRFIDGLAASSRKTYHNIINSFFDWLLDEYCTDADSIERIVVPGFRNPFATAMEGLLEGLKFSRPSQSTKPPLGYEYILRAQNFLVPDAENVLQRRPSFRDLPNLNGFFNSRSDWIYIDEALIDRGDPNCIWRLAPKADRRINRVRVLVDSYQIWSPVRFVALYTLLRFPLRGQQILWLDSGEADYEQAVLTSEGISWERNPSPLALESNRRHPQAAIQRGHNDAPKFYATTNKTGSVADGYEIDWVPDDLVYWFLMLREWQAKYNPLKEPTRWSDISLRAETNDQILKARGTQCFLFRTSTSGQPMITTTAFTHTLPALLHAIQRPGEKLAAVVPMRGRRKSFRCVSPYTPHSLRVSLITAFIVDGNAPIHIISKLVGHRTLVMTIYYTKLNSHQMRQAMGEAEKRAAQIANVRYVNGVRNKGLQPFRHQLIATDGNRSFLESDSPGSACVVFDWGVCPMSGAACHIGGSVIVERKVESFYSPVEAGYLGLKNCPRCRFFVTGVPFLGGLVALANELSLEVYTESERFQRHTSEFESLERAYYDACKSGRQFGEEADRKKANDNRLQSAAKLDGLVTDYVAVHNYVQAGLKLVNQGVDVDTGESGIRLIAGDGLADVSLELEDSSANYHLLAEICQNATIYSSTNPSRAIPLISQVIDRILENNNMAPALFRLDDAQKLIVANELNSLLIQRLGSWERIDDIITGNLMLLDIDAHQPELVPISTEIQQLLSKASRASRLYYECSTHA